MTESRQQGSAAAAEPGHSARLTSALAWTTATTLVIGAFAFVSSPIVSQALGSNGRGRLVVVQLAPQLLADLASIGLGFAIVHYGARRNSSIRTLLRWSLRPLFIGSMVMFSVGQLIAPVVAAGSAADERLMRWYLLLCPLTAYISVPIEAMRALGHYKTWNLFVLLRGVSWPIVMLVAVSVAADPLRFIVIVHLIVTALLLGVVWVVVLARTSHLDRAPATTTREYLGYGLASAVSTIPRSANAKLDQLVMTALVSRGNLGLYAAAVGWSALTVPFMRALASVTMPHVSSASADDRRARVARLLTFALAAVVLLTVVGLAATVLLFRRLYGVDFEGAYPAAMVLIPGALLLEFNAVLGNVLRSLDRPKLVAILEAAVMVGSTIALLSVLTLSQVLGPAIVSLGTYLVAAVVYAILIARRLGVKTRSLVTVEAVWGASMPARRTDA